jgi:excisionase family DNA binding protein
MTVKKTKPKRKSQRISSIDKRPVEYINTKQAANRLGCGTRHITRLCRHGLLKESRKLGGVWRIPKEQFEILRTQRKALVGDGRACGAFPLESIVIMPDYKPPEPIAERIRDLALSGIAVECAELCSMAEDLQGCLIHPGDHPEAESAVPRIRQAASEQLSYINQAIEDLKSLDSGGTGIPAGKR